jgi:hypothetical protein
VQLPQGNWTQKMNQAVVDLSPCFLGVKRLRGAFGLAWPAALRSAGLHVALSRRRHPKASTRTQKLGAKLDPTKKTNTEL